MCRFCVEHGEGERWYLQASNYAYDLESDLRRRDYVVGFVRDFDRMRANAIAGMELLGRLPGPVERLGKSMVSRRMQGVHFGQPLTIEDCERVFNLATSITVIPCICRMHAPNRNAEEVCILVTTQPVDAILTECFADYEGGPSLEDFHRLDTSQALDLLRESEQAGLMHSIWTFETPFTAAICNCNVQSGCMAMRLTQSYKMKLMWRGEMVAAFDENACSACGACVDRCPFDALALERTTTADGRRTRRLVHPATRCWGCGICRSACPNSAITMVDRRSMPQVAALW